MGRIAPLALTGVSAGLAVAQATEGEMLPSLVVTAFRRRNLVRRGRVSIKIYSQFIRAGRVGVHPQHTLIEKNFNLTRVFSKRLGHTKWHILPRFSQVGK